MKKPKEDTTLIRRSRARSYKERANFALVPRTRRCLLLFEKRSWNSSATDVVQCTFIYIYARWRLKTSEYPDYLESDNEATRDR